MCLEEKLVPVGLLLLWSTCRLYLLWYLRCLALRLPGRSAVLAWWLLLNLAVVVSLLTADVLLLMLTHLDSLGFQYRHHSRSCFMHRTVKMSCLWMLSLVVHLACKGIVVLHSCLLRLASLVWLYMVLHRMLHQSRLLHPTAL